MPRLFALLVLVSLSGLLGGCGLSEEDKDFYYRGWLRPTDLDRQPPSRLGPRTHRESGGGYPGGGGHYKADPLID